MADKAAEDVAGGSQRTGVKEEDPVKENNTGEEGGGWWGSWINTAKSKSAEVFTMVKKDLDELGIAVKSEASHVICTTSNVIGKTLKLDEPESTASTVKRSFSLFIDQMSTALNPLPEDDEAEAVLITGGDTPTLVSYQRELEALQRVDATYLVPGSGPEFDAWRSARAEGVVDPTAIKRRLEQSPILREQYNKLVPDPVAEDDFWERYLFRLALLQDRIANSARRRSAPSSVNVPDKSTNSADPVVSHIVDDDDDDAGFAETVDDSPVSPPKPLKKSPSWEEDEDFLSDMELSEEQQIKLLQEYEEEMYTGKKGKSPKSKNGPEAKNQSLAEETRNAEAIVKAPSKAGVRSKKAVKKSGQETTSANMVEDHFESASKKNSKSEEKNANDDASSVSDESWEKEFEIEDDKPENK